MSNSTHLDATAPEPSKGKVSIEQQPATHAARKGARLRTHEINQKPLLERIAELEAEVARLRRERDAAIQRAEETEAAPWRAEPTWQDTESASK